MSTILSPKATLFYTVALYKNRNIHTTDTNKILARQVGGVPRLITPTAPCVEVNAMPERSRTQSERVVLKGNAGVFQLKT